MPALFSNPRFQTPNPHSVIRDPQSPLGFVTAYVPEELFHAAGFTPVFIFHTSSDHGQARSHLPGFTCWAAGSVLDQALSGCLDRLTGIALAKTCDTVQGLVDLWQRNVPSMPCFHVGMPVRLDSPTARAYLLTELDDLRQRIQAQGGRAISDDDLWESIALYNQTRTLVRQVYAHAADLAPPDLYELVRAAFQTPKRLYNDNLTRLLSQPFLPPDQKTPDHSVSILLVGSELGDPILFDVLAHVGVRVVGDLLDLGERYVAVDSVMDGDPLAALADRLLALLPTPTQHHPQRSRSAHLLALVRERDADGVILARQKFCDPHGFDHVQLTQTLAQAQVPYLTLELEQASQAGQLCTRVEAFVEMITQVGG
ncbi:MAG TPA: 2-hydroxyacyl-CoA dehydratase [Chloroflexi bacterium]|nr:2-hydroxyacyl-CoA dehydratase [Chloroflexota bacterium]